MNNFIVGLLIALGIVIGCGSFLFPAISRNGAMIAHMTPQEYVSWMNAVNDLNKNK